MRRNAAAVGEARPTPLSRPAGHGAKKRGPGRPRRLDHATVVRVGVRVADSEGLDALTMARVASELGVAIMTLYTYVPSKERLLDEVVEAAMDEAGPPTPSDDPASWRGVVLDALIDLHDVIRRHWILMETAGRRPTLTTALKNWLEGMLEVLEWAGFAPEEVPAVYHSLVTQALGGTFLRIAHLPGLPRHGQESESIAQYPRLSQTTKLLRERVARSQLVADLRRIVESLDGPAVDRSVVQSGRGRSTPMPTAGLQLPDHEPATADHVLDTASVVALSDRRPPRASNVAPLDGGATAASGPMSATIWLRTEAVRLVAEVRAHHDTQTASIRSVASKLGIPESVLTEWVEPDAGVTRADELELRRLRAEVNELQQVNRILRSATSICGPTVNFSTDPGAVDGKTSTLS